jgi:tRNA(fMet)-specific endonuclease VapC
VSFLLDTDTCSAHLKQRGSVTNRFLQYTGQLYVSVITIGELRTWATRAGAPAGRGRGVDAMLADVTVLTVTVAEANKFGELRAGLLDIERPTPEIDLWIAATALVHDLTLVTHNLRDFSHIPGLRLDDWLIP